ncbi:protein SGT1 homolog A-like isoform X4 [Camellia sinensis]|uniref:protein SGT1 homolog A-like isoform X4 n=1 Tax=Camellia sinensis TaxID=4442 RepID=UPI0010362FF3|nr:protein SGT1 homolog A-like isoform X4 [Camellia sinensis]
MKVLQKPKEVVVTIFAKGVPEKNVSINFGEQIRSVTIDVPGGKKFHFQPRLFGKKDWNLWIDAGKNVVRRENIEAAVKRVMDGGDDDREG